jgi:hypothetical protein
VVGPLVEQVAMMLEQRNDNIPVASLSPVEETLAASFGRVLKNRSFLLLWLAQLLLQPGWAFGWGNTLSHSVTLSLCHEERPTRFGK